MKMKILMMTNTFTPHIGGVANSVAAFTDQFRKLGHRVLIVAPEFENLPSNEQDVIRIPAIQKFNGSDFSISLPLPSHLEARLEKFDPDIIHSHHPFLIGNAAVRLAKVHRKPLVFTHHTMYEEYTHYVPVHSPKMKKFVANLSTGYANMCNLVIAPSQSTAEVLRSRGVTAPVISVPTGIDVEKFAAGDGQAIRKEFNIPASDFVVGHLGRLAPEKNLSFLARAVAEFVAAAKDRHFLVIGDGPSTEDIKKIFREKNISHRLQLTGKIHGQAVIDAYHAMDIFAFSSKTETQGMVLTEAMAARVPVVAIDAPGAAEVVIDNHNGRLVTEQTTAAFTAALEDIYARLARDRHCFEQPTAKTAQKFSIQNCAQKILDNYRQLTQNPAFLGHEAENIWKKTIEQIKAQWQILTNMADAAQNSFQKNK